jgi:hypothetical protein
MSLLGLMAAGFGGAIAGGFSVAFASGHVYRLITPAQRAAMQDRQLYYFCPDTVVDHLYDARTGNLSLTRRKRGTEPNVWGRKAIYLYVGHGKRGGRSNHPRRWRRNAALFEIVEGDLRSHVGDARIYYRRWDSAIAILGDYRGPAALLARGVDVITTKNGALPRPTFQPE